MPRVTQDTHWTHAARHAGHALNACRAGSGRDVSVLVLLVRRWTSDMMRPRHEATDATVVTFCPRSLSLATICNQIKNTPSWYRQGAQHLRTPIQLDSGNLSPTLASQTEPQSQQIALNGVGFRGNLDCSPGDADFRRPDVTEGAPYVYPEERD